MAISRNLDDAAIVRAALEASGMPATHFAAMLGRDNSTLTRSRNGSRAVDPLVRLVCAAIVDDPPLAARLAAIASELRTRGAD
jgi:hypothetical protein